MTSEAFAAHGQPLAPRPSALSPRVGNRAMLLYVVAATALQLLLVGLFRLSIGLTLLIEGLVLVVLYPVVFRAPWRELTASARWRTPPEPLTLLGAFALGFVASRAFTVFLQAVWPQSGQALQNYNLQFLQGGGLVWVLLGGGLLIPFVEELVFRGFGLTGYERRRSPLVAALLTSVLFALVHGVPAQVLAVLPLGFVIALAVQFSGSFWTGVGIHVLNNSLSLALAGLLLSNPAFERLVEQGAGGARVPLATGLVALLFGLAAVWGALRWLRPRQVVPPERGGVWSWSLLVPLGFFVLTAVLSLSGERLSHLFNFARPQ